jgi:hypothetical protein
MSDQAGPVHPQSTPPSPTAAVAYHGVSLLALIEAYIRATHRASVEGLTGVERAEIVRRLAAIEQFKGTEACHIRNILNGEA